MVRRCEAINNVLEFDFRAKAMKGTSFGAGDEATISISSHKIYDGVQILGNDEVL